MDPVNTFRGIQVLSATNPVNTQNTDNPVTQYTDNPVNTQNIDNPVNTQSINMPTGTQVLCARNSSTHEKSTLHYETIYLVFTFIARWELL